SYLPLRDSMRIVLRGARLNIARNVKLGIPKALFERDQLLVIVADRILLGHADAAMQLDTLCAHELASVAGSDLRRGHCSLAFGGCGLEQGHTTIENGARLLYLDKHLRH